MGEKINKMEKQFGKRNQGKNMNTASSMMMNKKRKKPKGIKNVKNNKKGSAIPKGAGSPLLDINEIAKLNAARESDAKKSRSSKLKKGKKLNGTEDKKNGAVAVNGNAR